MRGRAGRARLAATATEYEDALVAAARDAVALMGDLDPERRRSRGRVLEASQRCGRGEIHRRRR